MGAMFSKPKMPDTSKQEAALAAQDARVAAEEQAAKKKETAQMAARRARTSGKASLITGAETGVSMKNTLG